MQAVQPGISVSGCSFCPRKSKERQKLKCINQGKPMNGNAPLVGIIDDELSVRESLSDLLESVGLKAQAFASADEFLTKWSLEVPSCLVLDVQMPGISGLAPTATAQRRYQDPHCF